MKKRKFVEGEINHTYQRTISGGNIFYEVDDYLVYYTIYSIMSVKYKVVVYGLCLMIDHIHSLCANIYSTKTNKPILGGIDYEI